MNFEHLINVGLQLTLKICSRGMDELTHTGHVISLEGIVPDLMEVVIVQACPPKNVEGIHPLGVFNHYRRFINTYVAVATPLYWLLKTRFYLRWG